jgi:pimeloyl-ACP methyl ester carboxylesterase
MAIGLAELDAFARSPNLRRLKIVGKEALALAKQATLIHRDWGQQLPSRARSGEDVVVVLHGLFATAGVLVPLKRHIEQQTGAHTASFTYGPGAGVTEVAQRLSRLIDRLPEHVSVHLVGHSMGGLAARWYVQELGGDPRVVQTISIATPFAGTNRALLWPVRAGRDMRSGSDVLWRLTAGAARGRQVPHLSIAAASDQLVPSGACFGEGDAIVIQDCGHNGLLFHPDVASEIVRRILVQSPPPSSYSSSRPPSHQAV